MLNSLPRAIRIKLKIERSAIATVAAVVLLVIILVAAGGVYYLLATSSSGRSNTVVTSSTSHTSAISTEPTTSTSSVKSSTPSTSSTTPYPPTSTTTSSTGGTSTSSTSSTTSGSLTESTETSTCTSSFTTTVNTGGRATSFDVVPLIGNFSSMTVDFNGQFEGNYTSVVSSYTRLYWSPTTFKVNASSVSQGQSFSTAAVLWVLRNGTVLAAETSILGEEQNLTGAFGSSAFLEAMQGFLFELEYNVFLSAISSASQVGIINSTLSDVRAHERWRDQLRCLVVALHH